VIKQLRTQATLFQRQGDLERPQTKEELTVLNRWLDWFGKNEFRSVP